MSFILIAFLFGCELCGCTIDKGDGTFNIDAEITQVGNTIMSIKYKIGQTWVFDDLVMKDNMGLFAEIKKQHTDTVPLRIHIEFNTTDEPSEEGFLKYYYGANLLGESKSFDVASLVLIAKQNQELFNWDYRDEHVVNEERDEEEVEMTQKSTTPEKIPVKVKKEKAEKL